MWHKLKARELTEEEENKEFKGYYDFMWEGVTPLPYEVVFVTFGRGYPIFADKMVDIDTGINFENTELKVGDVVYWCKLKEGE